MSSNNINLIKTIGLQAKKNTENVFIKTYEKGYSIEVDFAKNIINYGNGIKIGRDTCLNIGKHHEENLVTLECVDKLLAIGYQPQSIFLEKGYPAGRGVTKYLDILVSQNEQPYIMIECKTAGEEFEKELKNTKQNGGQLFTYFQQDTKAELLMLYASEMQCKIIKVEDEFRNAGSVQSAFKVWNKKFYESGFWENTPYDFKNEVFTKLQLKELTEDAGKKLFHGFATILRKHSVSDKPNAFNVIFNLFLAKLYDEQKGDDDELEFQWKKDDDPVDFQVRLHNLHKEGLNDFLKKEIEGIYNKDFDAKTPEELYNAKKRLLKFNKFFTIKEVFDDETFDQNQRVLREVVQLIEKYQIRYPRKQKYLSEFFELLLTTGLKQEAGQYFTPPPIAKFIVKSLPLPEMIRQELNNPTPNLPAVIDYAAGSGHFITEIMEEYQDVINNIDASKLSYPNAKTKVKIWSQDGEAYSWASSYIYGIEKDYRLVKVAKVGCYFYGDGVAQIIHGDGLDSLTNPPKSYIGLLQQNTNAEDSAKNKFSVVVANPPYSVKYCKEDLEYTGSQNDFTLYPYLTENSNEIESLFVERTKQLLKDGGVAGVILPSSILSNEGIYTKAREIILQNFEIVAITELGSNTFMATGTNTIVLFLRRRNNNDSIKQKEFIERFFIDFIDNNPPIPFNIIEKPIAKYVNYVWETVTLADYVSLLKNKPNENIAQHELYKTYRKSVEQKIETEITKAQKNRKTQLSDDDVQKIKIRIEIECRNIFIATEKEKLLYFLLAYNQKVVLVKTGAKDAEKRFLGYEFSNAKGNEGIHPIQRGKTIDECTKLYNEKDFEDGEKASNYIYKAFAGDYETEIPESLKNNISRVNLVDMLTFDRESFAKNISTAIKKKVRFESKWEVKRFNEIAVVDYGTRIVKKLEQGTLYPVYGGGNETFKADNFNRKDTFIISRFGMSPECVRFVAGEFFLNDSGLTVTSKKTNVLSQKYLDYFFYLNQEMIYLCGRGVAQKNLDMEAFNALLIPLPPLEIQQKIVSEIEVLEKQENEAKGEIEKGKEQIESICLQAYSTYNKEKLSQLAITNPSKSEISNLDINTLISFVDMPAISNDGYIANKIDRPYYEVKKGSYTYFKENDIIVAKITPCMENGKCALATNLTNGLALGSSEFHVFRANNKKINTKYLFTLLNRKSIREEAEKNMTGASGHRRVPIAFYENLEIPLPPLPEQQKIVSEIEKIEMQITELEQSLKEIPKQKEEILKKYL